MLKRYSSDPKTRAAELVAEGKIGGKREGAGRPRKVTTERQRKRASTVVAEAAAENADKIAGTLLDVLLSEDATRSEKMRAVRVLTRIEGTETDRERDELADPNSSLSQELAQSADQAKANLARMLSDPVTGQRLRATLAGLVAEAGSSPSITP